MSNTVLLLLVVLLLVVDHRYHSSIYIYIYICMYIPNTNDGAAVHLSSHLLLQMDALSPSLIVSINTACNYCRGVSLVTV